MYTSFRIQNFRCFEDLELKDLARVNLIAGKNNTGKTSILEVVALYSGDFNPSLLLRTESTNVERRPPYRASMRSIPDWNLLFNNFDTDKVILLSAEYEGKSEQLPLFPQIKAPIELTVLDRDKDYEAYEKALRRSRIIYKYDDMENVIQGGKALRLLYQNNEFFIYQLDGRVVSDKLPPTLLPVVFIPSREQIPPEENAARFSNVRRSRQDSILVEALKIIEPRITELELLSINGTLPVIHGEIGLQEPVPLSAMGEGVGRITSLILAIANASGGVVLIDEIENGLHYSVLTDVWKAIGKAAREFDVQVFATTHSFEMIKAAHIAFAESEPYDFRYHRLDRRKAGNMVVVTYEEEDLETSLDANFEVR